MRERVNRLFRFVRGLVVIMARYVGDVLLRAGHWFMCPHCRMSYKIFTREAYASAEAVYEEREALYNRLRWQGFTPMGYKVVVGGRMLPYPDDVSGRRVFGGTVVATFDGISVKRVRYANTRERAKTSISAYARPLDRDFAH